MIYLDNNATTKFDPSVIERMIEHLKCSDQFGNASSSHLQGRKSRLLIEECRKNLRRALNAKHNDEILLTSGGTESNNLALNGIIRGHSSPDEIFHVITSPFEHPSVDEILRHLQEDYPNSLRISQVKVDGFGLIDLDDFERLIRPETRLVTIMHSNNEIGSIAPMKEIVRLCRERGPADLLVHTDASQSLGKVLIDVDDLGVDLLTVCSHKFHGPQGVGALYLRRGIELERLIFGANHERGLRPGTENVLALVGLSQAALLLADRSRLEERIQSMKRTRDRLAQRLNEHFQSKDQRFSPKRNGPEGEACLPNTLNLSFPFLDASLLIDELKDQLAFSTGSACHSHSHSHSQQSQSSTLKAIGNPFPRGTIRLSTSFMTTDEEIDLAVRLLSSAIDEQQRRSFYF